MKITFEFDTLSENFEYAELYAVQDAQMLVHTISKILDLARYYEKYDNRSSIPAEEVVDKIRDTILDCGIITERYGY